MSGIQQVVFSGPLILAAPIAAAAGAITFISPCCLPLVPGYLAYATGMSGTDVQTARPRADRGAGRRAAEAGLGAPAGERGAEAHDGAARDGRGGVAVGAPPAVAPPAPPGRGRTIVGTLLFVLGFSALFAVYGAASGSLGGTLLAHHQGTVTAVLGA